MKLFCIPYAGGSAVIYHNWQVSLPASVKVVPLELAGRGSRFSEPLQPQIQQMAEELYRQIADNTEPYVIFGHSMGGLLTYEVMQLLQSDERPLPEQLFISGCEPPNYKLEKYIDTSLPDKEFLQEVVDLGGTPEEILANEEFIQLLAPIVKNDFLAIEKYQFQLPKQKISIPVTILSGKKDTEVHSKVLEWQIFCAEPCHFIDFEDGHFFIQTQEEELLEALSEILSENAGM